MSLVHRVDGYSNKSHLIVPSVGELAKLAEQSRATHPVPGAAATRDVPVRRLRRRLPPQVIEVVVARYTAGEAIRALSRDYGVSRDGLCTLLQTEGVALRTQSITPEDIARAARLYHQGLTIRKVAEQVGCSYGTLRKAFHEHDVVLRTGGRQKRALMDER